MILPGILSSQISGHLYSYSTDFYQIATATVTSGGTSTITFSSIPSTYKHLQIRAFGQSGGSGGAVDPLSLQFNGSSASGDYDTHSLSGNGSAASASSRTSYGDGVGLIGRNGNWGGCVIDILDYASTTKNKTVRALGGGDANGSGIVQLSSYLWHPSTIAAITSIAIDPNGNGFNQYSQIALYGAN